MQEKIISKPQAVGNKTNLSDIRPNAIMSKLLDEIEANVFKEAEEGEVVSGEGKESKESESI